MTSVSEVQPWPLHLGHTERGTLCLQRQRRSNSSLLPSLLASLPHRSSALRCKRQSQLVGDKHPGHWRSLRYQRFSSNRFRASQSEGELRRNSPHCHSPNLVPPLSLRHSATTSASVTTMAATAHQAAVQRKTRTQRHLHLEGLATNTLVFGPPNHTRTTKRTKIENNQTETQGNARTHTHIKQSSNKLTNPPKPASCLSLPLYLLSHNGIKSNQINTTGALHFVQVCSLTLTNIFGF